MNSATRTTEEDDAVARELRRSRLRVVNPTERYLNGVASLPPSPTLVTELLTLFRDPDRDVDEVVKLISYEPALTAQVLRICNSACFAGEQPPSDIFEAVSRLGFYQVYCLVVSIFGARARAISGADKGLNVEELWRHSVAVAVSASVVAEEAGHPKAAAFTAGLLHDIGKLVLASAEGEAYAGLIQDAKEQGAAPSELECANWGTDHAELGGELMRRWNLPPDVVAAVRYHHQIEASAPYQQLTAAVHLGNTIAHHISCGESDDSALLKSSSATLAALQFSAGDLPRLIAKTQDEMERVKGTLEI